MQVADRLVGGPADGSTTWSSTRPSATSRPCGDTSPRACRKGNQLEHALGAAALYGRRDVVEFLLGKGPDLSFADPSFGATASGAARYNGHTEIAALIDERRAG